MLVSDLIYRLRNFSGNKSRGVNRNSGAVIVNDNEILEAINNAQKQLASDQFRPFIQTISLSPEFLLANDQYKFLNNYGWDSAISYSSTTPASQYLKIPVNELSTRPMYFYDEVGFNSPSFSFQGELTTYYPNEFSINNGPLTKVRTHEVTTNLNYSFDEPTLNTFKISFNVFADSAEKPFVKFDIELSNVPFVFKRVNSDLTIIVDFSSSKITYTHKGVTTTTYTVEYLSYPYGRAGMTLLYNSKIRKLNANTEGVQSKDMQLYVAPYSVVDPTQQISNAISGDASLIEYFIVEAAYQLQVLQRDITGEIADIRAKKRSEYIDIDCMTTHNNHAFFPSI